MLLIPPHNGEGYKALTARAVSICSSSSATTRRCARAGKQSTGVEDPSASKRCSSTPLHWKPHFSRMLREAGLADPRAGHQLFDIELLEGEIDHRARRFGGKTLAPMLDAQPVAEFRRVRMAPVDADHADRHKIVLDQEHPSRACYPRIARTNSIAWSCE